MLNTLAPADAQLNGHAPERLRGPHAPAEGCDEVILSFDVEEHYRIEAAAQMEVDIDLQAHYLRRLEISVQWLLEQLGQRGIRSTFFVVAHIARRNPGLIKTIHRCGHEIASHSLNHKRLHHFTPATFREDLRSGKDILEQLIGEAVSGFRAPTFSLVPDTAWAVDVLAEAGLLYDSSIFPVWHDRYGVPGAPRTPFLARGFSHKILELPPVTWRFLGHNVPVGGGGYFRLLPLFFLRRGLRQCTRRLAPRAPMLYFHPWEFDPAQARLPMGRLNSFRTYVGLGGTQRKFARLLDRYRFVPAREMAGRLVANGNLECFHISRKGAKSPLLSNGEAPSEKSEQND